MDEVSSHGTKVMSSRNLADRGSYDQEPDKRDNDQDVNTKYRGNETKPKTQEMKQYSAAEESAQNVIPTSLQDGYDEMMPPLNYD